MTAYHVHPNRPKPSRFARNRSRPRIVYVQGAAHRSVDVTPIRVAIVSLVVVLLLGWSVTMTAFVIFKDDVVASLIRKNAQTAERYETTITALRLEVDSIRARQFIDQGAFEDVLESLATRQSSIEDRQDTLLSTLERARSAGLGVSAHPTGPSDPVLTGTPSQDRAALNADHRVVLAARGQMADRPLSRPAAPPRDVAALAAIPDGQSTRRARQIDASLRAIVNQQAAALNAVERDAKQALDGRKRILARAGLAESRFKTLATADVGGPFIAAEEAIGLPPYALQVARIDRTLEQLDRWDTVLQAIPIDRPMPAGTRISSGFGNRLDPFLKRRAFHAGLDYAAPTGTKVRAPASGRVVKAGWVGGYGRLIEIDHGNGISTRYGHLSRILVKVGTRVSRSDVIGRVGSTGRSTGPHLHYETRIDGKAVDPYRFLSAL